MHHCPFIMLVAIWLAACTPHPIRTMSNPVYEYSDGAANHYIVHQDSVEYQPVPPELSSTNRYNGGDPFKVAIDQAQFDQFVLLIETANQNPAIRLADRVKGSGLIVKHTGPKSVPTHFIIAMNSAERQAIEAWLKALPKQ